MASLADSILAQDLNHVTQMLQYGANVNEIDEYGFTPLIEAAIINHIPMSALLLSYGADPNQQDVTGGSALQWAAENNNLELCQLLIKHQANPNCYNFAGQPILTMPTLRRQKALRKFLISSGADEIFVQDYINTKLLGHLFELVGNASIVAPNHQLVDVDFEGFFLEVTIGLIANSLASFQNHFAARNLRKYAGLSQFIVETLERASALIKYQQYQIDINQYQTQIDALINLEEPMVIPVGYEGHAITFITFENFWIKCDRREDSRLYDNIMFYRVTNRGALNRDLIKRLLYQKQNSEFVNQTLDQLLGLEPLTELKVDAQVSGNCSWANVEATIPALFFLVMMRYNQEKDALSYYKSLALNFFHRWREWNKDRSLSFCIQSYQESNAIRKACKAEILAAILFQRLNPNNPQDQVRIDTILSVLIKSPYEYLLKNYLRIYYYESNTEEGRRFAELLKANGVGL